MRDVQMGGGSVQAAPNEKKSNFVSSFAVLEDKLVRTRIQN